jgi:hypothetical protein
MINIGNKYNDANVDSLTIPLLIVFFSNKFLIIGRINIIKIVANSR